MSQLNGTGLLGLFPALGALGGVEASGRIAWDGLLASDRLDMEKLQLFEYKANGANGSSGLEASKAPSFTTSARSKAEAILRALNTPGRPRHILVWHIGLLKLLPFFRSPDAEGILYLHGIESWKKQDLLTQRALRRVGLFLSNSDFTWSRFLSYHPEFATIPHQTVSLGIGDSFSREVPTPDGRPMALMVGRMAEGYKGHKEVIEAWPKVLLRIPNARLCIVGGGGLRVELETLARARGLSESVQFVGEVSEEQKEELLLKSRCLAMPSRGEGFGLVYLEAMRLGRPCLVSTLDAGREVVNPPEAGLAADPQKPDQLAGALCRLMEEGEEWSKWSANARRRYEENYTARHFQQRLLAALFPEDR
jgi:phosphatidylinositol alpha-1,6-mannosyltransferase